MSTFTTSRDRDAWNTFRGYVYQVHLTIERWLDLRPEQTLELERGEDIDIVDIVSDPSTGTCEERQRLLEQVKHRQESITLRKPEAITAIACFLEHQENNLGANLHFRYTSNVKEGQERPSPMPKEISAIAAWKQIWQGSLQETARNDALQGIRTILENVKQPDKLHDKTWQIFREFIEKPNDNQLLNLICHFEWNTEAPKASSLSLKLQERLIERQQATDHIQAEQQYQKLFVYLFKILCEPGIKKLTVKKLIEQLSDTLSESDHQRLKDVVNWVHALEEGMEALEQNVSQNNEEILLIKEKVLRLDRERSKPYDGQDVASRVQELLRDYTIKLFVGREDALSKLDNFLTQTDKKYLTITAPAGFGKTALLANWIAMRQDKGYFIAYHFFQRDDITRSVSNAYRNLLRQLHDYYESSDKSLPTNEDELRDKLRYLLENYEVQENKPLVIVVDGLDEATPERSLSLFLPQPLPKGLYVIVSVRVNEVEKLDNLNLRTQVTQKLHLNPLLSPTIADWLRRTGNESLVSLAQDETFVAQVCDRTEGIPLFLKYLIDELVEVAQQGEESAIRKTLAATPKGFADYIRQQYQALDQLEDWRSRPDLRKIFYFLTIAKGELSSDDLVELMGESPVGLPWRVSRWFKIRQLEDCLVFSFTHSTLAEEFAILPEIKKNTEKSQKELIKYCADWQEHHSAYALRHYAEHLREVKRWEELYAIARNEDFAVALQEQLPDEPNLPLKTVQTALLGAANRDDVGAMAEFLLVHARHLVQTTSQESPLDTLRSGSLDRALALADLYEIERRILWYLLLAWELKDESRLEEAGAILERLQNKELTNLSHWKSNYAAYLLAQLADINKDAFTALHQRLFLNDDERRLLCEELIVQKSFAAALQVIENVNDRKMKQWGMFRDVAIAQAQAGDFSEAFKTVYGKITIWGLHIAQAPESIQALASIAVACAQVGAQEAAHMLFDRALEQTSIEKVGQAAWEFNRPYRVQILKDIAVAMVEAGYKKLAQATLANALESTKQVKSKREQSKLLREIAVVQAKAGDKQSSKTTFTLALEAARKVKSQWEKLWELRDIAIAQAQANEFDKAHQTVQEIEEKGELVKALVAIAEAEARTGNKQSSQDTFATALKVTQDIQDELGHRKGITFSEFGKFEIDVEALEIERAWEDSLGYLAVAQAKLEKSAALETANRISDTAKQEVLRDIAIVEAHLGKFTAALEITQGINSEKERAEALGEIAKKQAKAKETKAARTTLAKLLKLVIRSNYEGWRSSVLDEIAKVQAIGKKSEVTAPEQSETFNFLPKTKEELQQELNLLAATAAEKVLAGELAAAREIADAVEDEWEWRNVLAAIAIAQVHRDELDAAIDTLSWIDYKWVIEVKIIVTIAIKQAQKGERILALNTFVYALEIVSSQFDEEDLEDERVESLEVIAEGLLLSREFYLALKAASWVKDDKLRAEIEKKIAVAQAQIESGQQALKIGETILTDRHWHLPDIAKALAEKGDTANFKKLLIPCAYYLDVAYRMCKHLARLYPEKAEEIAKVVSELG
jgi:hypothetical protein